MPTFTAGAFGADFDQIDIASLGLAAGSNQSSTSFTLSLNGQVDNFFGSGFSFGTNGFPTVGIITHLQETFGGNVVFDIDGMNLPVSQFLGWVSTGDNDSAKSTIFAGNDLISGSGGNDRLHGYAGDDTIIAGDGNDFVDGGDGNDSIAGGLGNDVIVDSGGTNYLRGNEGDDVISGGSGFDDANGNQGNDTIHGNAGDDYSVGGKGDDLLFGDAGDDIVWGNLGNDTCNGGDGNDQVRGGQGDDVINGGAGNDYVSGDRGNDTITGGPGADLFHGSQDAGIDKVMDFSVAEGDRVLLDPGTTYTISQVGADTVLDMGNGNQMILVGVSMTSLLPTSIFFG